MITDRTHSHPKCPVSIYSDNEVDYIDKKHDGIYVTHRTVFWVDDVIEKLPYGYVNVKGAVEKKSSVRHNFLLRFIHLIGKEAIIIVIKYVFD